MCVKKTAEVQVSSKDTKISWLEGDLIEIHSTKNEKRTGKTLRSIINEI